jgi:hypothetical protein
MAPGVVGAWGWRCEQQNVSEGKQNEKSKIEGKIEGKILNQDLDIIDFIFLHG